MSDESIKIELTRAELRAVAGYAARCARAALEIFECEGSFDWRSADRRSTEQRSAEPPGDDGIWAAARLASRQAIESAQAFADGGERTQAIRDAAWAAMRAANAMRDAVPQNAEDALRLRSGQEAARAALAAAGAAFLHPLAKATQVKHILGSAGHAARAFELAAGDVRAVGDEHIERFRGLASAVVVDVLKRYPLAPPGGGRVGELIRQLDALLRNRSLSGLSD